MSTKIDFSGGESSILGLKVGRCNSDFFDEASLYRQITEGSYDLCRLKIPAEDEMASVRLNKTGLPFYFSGSIRRYKTRITEKPAGTYNFPDLIFEMYDGTQDKLLMDMLVGTWGTYPIGYYRSPYLESLVTKEKEIECVYRFYKKYNLNKDYPGNSIMFIKHGDAYVGFFALNILNGNLESHVGGILEPYRKSGYFLDKLRYIKEFCISNGLENFIFGARNENADVQRIFQYVGFQPRGSENVFHIPSLLTFSHREPVMKEINFPEQKSNSVYQQLLAECLRLAEDILPGYNISSFNLNQFNPTAGVNSCKIKISFPVLSDNELMLVLRGDMDNPAFTGYFRAFKG